MELSERVIDAGVEVIGCSTDEWRRLVSLMFEAMTCEKNAESLENYTGGMDE